MGFKLQGVNIGTRGPQPKLKLRSNAIDDLTPPLWLKAEAKAYWSTHCQQLQSNQLLTRETSESFSIHCDLWGRLCEMREAPTTRAYLDLHKAFVTSCKFFRLIPSEKPNVKENRFADFTEIDL